MCDYFQLNHEKKWNKEERSGLEEEGGGGGGGGSGGMREDNGGGGRMRDDSQVDRINANFVKFIECEKCSNVFDYKNKLMEHQRETHLLNVINS